MTEVVVTLKAPALTAFGRSLTSARHRTYARELAAAQAAAQRNVLAAIPAAQVRWRYRLVANGFAVVVPTADLSLLEKVRGVAKVWPSVTYHSLSTSLSYTSTRHRAQPGPAGDRRRQALGTDARDRRATG